MQMFVLRRPEDIGEIGMDDTRRGCGPLAHDGAFLENRKGLVNALETF